LVSAIIGPLGHSRQVALAWESALFSAVTSAGIIANLEEKLSLERITKRYTAGTPATIRWMQILLSAQAELVLVPVHERQQVTGDPEDDYVLATGRIAKADYLVTGDKGLLDLSQHEGTRIISPRDFMELLDQHRANR